MKINHASKYFYLSGKCIFSDSQHKPQNHQHQLISEAAKLLCCRESTFSHENYIDQLTKVDLEERRVKIEETVHPNNSPLSGYTLIKNHDVYDNHPESQYSPLKQKPRKKSKKLDWYRKAKKLVKEKPFQDASKLVLQNMINLNNQDYLRLEQVAEKVLQRNPSNFEGSIQKFIAQCHINPNQQNLASRLISIRLSLFKIPIEKTTHKIAYQFLNFYYENYDDKFIEQVVSGEKNYSLLERLMAQLIYSLPCSRSFDVFLYNLKLTGPLYNYLLLIFQNCFNNIKTLKNYGKIDRIDLIDQIIASNSSLAQLDPKSFTILIREISRPYYFNNLRLDWDFAFKQSYIQLLYALLKIELGIL